MDDALTTVNMVYIGTLAIGGALLVFLTVAIAITLVIAGAGQAVASLVMAFVRLFSRRARPVVEPAVTAEAARTEYTRKAVVAKADAILAAQRAAATAATASSQTAENSPAQDDQSQDDASADEEVAIPAATAAKTAAGKNAPRPVVTPLRPVRHQPGGPHTGTQPALAGSRAS